jgi:cytochrome oxidase assembly protein ShyY1
VLLIPRFAALVLLAILLASAFVGLARWQYHRARPVIVPHASLSEPAIPVTDVVPARTPVPDAEVGRRVTVTGRYQTDEQLFVPDRTPRGLPTGPDDGPVGGWMLAPLATPDGTVVPVVRGWVPDAESAPAPPSGRVTVTGRLYASEDSALRDPNTTTTPAGEVDVVSAAELVSLWRGDLLDGYVAAVTEQPGTPGLVPVTPAGPPVQRGLHWRNAIYAFQWCCFAAFALFFAFRVVRDEAQQRAAKATNDPLATPPTVAS